MSKKGATYLGVIYLTSETIMQLFRQTNFIFVSLDTATQERLLQAIDNVQNEPFYFHNFRNYMEVLGMLLSKVRYMPAGNYEILVSLCNLITNMISTLSMASIKEGEIHGYEPR